MESKRLQNKAPEASQLLKASLPPDKHAEEVIGWLKTHPTV